MGRNRKRGGVGVVTNAPLAANSTQSQNVYQSIDYTNLPADTQRRATANVVPVVREMLKKALSPTGSMEELTSNRIKRILSILRLDVNNDADVQLIADLFGVFDADKVTDVQSYQQSAQSIGVSSNGSAMTIKTVNAPNFVSDVSFMINEMRFMDEDERAAEMDAAEREGRQMNTVLNLGDSRYTAPTVFIKLNLFGQKGSTGMGYTLIQRQLAAIDELARRGVIQINGSEYRLGAAQAKATPSNSEINGLATWPKLGFNIDGMFLPSSVRAYLRRKGFNYPQDWIYTSDLFSLRNNAGESGYDVWPKAAKTANNKIAPARFELKPNSISRRVFQEYGKRRGYEKMMQPQSRTRTSLPKHPTFDFTPQDDAILRGIWLNEQE